MAIGRQPAGAYAGGGLLGRPTASRGLVSWLTTIDHKRLGILYMLTSFAFFIVGTAESFVIRAQLARPELSLVSPEVYNQIFTMHGVTMVFLAIMPLGIGLGNYFIPLQIGARDLAFPRLNALGYWIFLFSGLLLYSSFFLGGAPSVGWFAYAPMTQTEFTGIGTDFYIVGLFINGIGTLVTAMNFIVTVVNMRAPGMTMMRVPLFTWMMLITAFIIIFAFPALTIGLVEKYMDRAFGTYFFDPSGGGLPILWQHLFWVFGHPEVYIIILPAFGVISEVIPTFSRKPLFGYPLMVLSGIFIAFVSFAVWSHHMFTTGQGPVANSAFAITSWIIGIPTGIKIFNWLGTMWAGQIRFTTSMLFAIAFLSTFVIGGITGIMVAVPPVDAQAQDSYFVVAHFHYVMGGGALLSFFAGVYYWFPKMTGRFLSERLGKWVFWLIAIGFHVIFFPQHLLGLQGMPRRIQTYEAGIGLELGNLISSSGIILVGFGGLLFLYSFLRDVRSGERAGADPWDGRTLEWATTSPPPAYDFAELPEVIDRDPVWMEKHPELIERRDPISKATEVGPRTKQGPPEHGIHIPGQSWYPIIIAFMLCVGGYGAIFQNWLLAIISLILVILGVYAWAFEGVGGTHVHPEPEAVRVEREQI